MSSFPTTGANPPDASAFSYPEIGNEPFCLTDAELAAAWGQPIPPKTERDTRLCFERIVAGKFTLYPEVWMRGPSGHRARIDYVGTYNHADMQGLIGFELKSSFVANTDFTGFSTALSQALDYRDSRVDSDIFAKADWFGKGLRYVFMFQCPYMIYENDNSRHKLSKRDWWAQGGLKFAGKYGVGAAFFVPRRHDWGLFIGGHPALWINGGPTPLGIKHSVSDRFASGR